MANEFKVRKGLIVQGSGSTILDIQGSQGQLFSVTDSLSGSLFSVNDISGVPIMEVFSDNRVNLGTFNAEAIKVSGSFATMTGSLFGTASWADNATSASFVPNTFLQNGNSFGTTATLGTNDNQSLQFETNNTTRMFISSSGNVGIGTSTPSSLVQVFGTTTASNFRISNSSYTNLMHVTGSSIRFEPLSFAVSLNNNELIVDGGVGLQTPGGTEAWVHIGTDPANGKRMRIDATQTSNNPPTVATTPDKIIGNQAVSFNITEALGAPDYWMEIELNSNGNIILIPCYTPGT